MIMKKMGYSMMIVGALGTGLVTYCLMNKNTKQKANKLLNTVMDEADKSIKKIG